MKQFQLPSLGSLRDRIRGFSLKDLLQHRELVLFAGMLLVVLYTVYMLVVEPEQRKLTRLETARQQLEEEIEALSADGVDENAETLQAELGGLEKDVKSAEANWKEYWQQGISEGISIGVFLREITLVPYSFGWKILAMEQLNREDSGLDPFLGTMQYKVTGEGTFAGLFRYLKRIETSMVPALVTEMDLDHKGENRQTLQGSFTLRVTGIRDEENEDQKEGEGS